ncbi:DUF4305 domain-containing protein [Terribacillus sp. DMT04]|uniref:DUF4305 domain-containing protein n=1 Tax=Terribacillus sp. DMT04 TaxID=2850441 RepID=UPI001C2BFF2E|nr:DUF4305 domain-containing protein [Terribacillus sp. DMT04]QXE02284.1 YdiK family protein [Terribacillus sp. DMT04]
MIRTPLPSAILNLVIGVLFISWAYNDVDSNGWGFFSVLLSALAAYDLYMSFRYFSLHFKIKKMNKKK